MALTTRGDGTGAAFQINSNWFNDFLKALTGVMTDQAYKFNYRPGSGTTPVLTLDGDGSGFLLRGLKTDHATTAFAFDSAGNLSISGNLTGVVGLTMSGALSGGTTGAFSSTVRASAFQGVAGVGASIAVHDNALGTVRNIKLYEGATDPATYDTVPEGSWWLKG